MPTPAFRRKLLRGLRVALPWLVRYVKEQFGRDADPAPAPKSPGLQPAAAEASARQ